MSITGRASKVVKGEWVVTVPVATGVYRWTISVERYEHGYMFLVNTGEGCYTNYNLYKTVRAAVMAGEKGADGVAAVMAGAR